MGNLISSEETPIATPATYIDSNLANEIITKQNILINNLKKAYTDLNLNIDINQVSNTSNTSINTLINNTTTIENFDTQGYSIKSPFELPLTKNNDEINDISKIYNNTVELLNDQSVFEDASFNAYINIQNKKIEDLQKAINNFPKNNNMQSNPVKSLKNLETSNLINVEEYRSPDIPLTERSKNANYIGNNSSRYPNYLIYGNNGCLEHNNSIIPNTYNFKGCNSNNSQQRFNLQQITTLEQYNNKIQDPLNKEFQLNNENSTIMGFYVVNPENDPNQCLTIDKNGLSVLPCNMSGTQRFKPYYHTVMP